MGLFESQEEMYEDDYGPRRSGPGVGVLFKILGGILLAPAIIIGAIHFWLLFAFGRLRVSVVSFITFFELLIVFPIINAYNPISNIISVFNFDGSFDLGTLIKSYLLICVIIGIIGAYVMIFFKAYQINNNPSLLFMDGWMYNFSYRDTPVELIRRRFMKKALIEGRYYSKEESPLGILQEPRLFQVDEVDDSKKSLESTKAEVVSRSYAEARKQTIITGETGSGKTVSMLSLMYNDIMNGYPICVIDFKKSPDVLYFLSKWAKDFGREFYYFANGDDSDKGNEFYGQKSTYDPFSSGEQSSRTDVILSLRQWDTASDVYKGRTESLLNALFFALLNVDHDKVPGIPWDEGGINQIIAAMEFPVMFDLIKALDDKAKENQLSRTDLKRLNTLKEIYTSLTNKSPEGRGLKEQLDGIKLLCNKLIMSSYGNWLSKGNSETHIDLLKISTSQNGPIVLFGLSPLEEEEFAKSMGAIIMSDLKRSSSRKNEMNNMNPFGVYVDEFQTIDPNDATDLLEKSRSAQFFCTLASQSLEKIASAAPTNGEATLKSVLDTCGNYLFHAGAQEDSAERMAKILGKTRHITRRASTKANTKLFSINIFNQRHGVVNKEVVEDWIIPPSKFQNLSSPNKQNGYKSEAYLITKFVVDEKYDKTAFGAQRIQVIAQKEITEGISDEFEEFIRMSAIARHKKETGEDISNYGHDNIIKPDKNNQDDFSDFDEYLSNGKTSNKSVSIDEYNDDEWNIEELSSTDSFSELSDDNEHLHGEPVTAVKPKTTEKPRQLKPERKLTSFEKMQMQQNAQLHKKKENKVEADKEDKNDKIFKLPDL